MLADLHKQPSPPDESFLQAVLASDERQRSADLEHHVPWNRHFLTCLRYTLGATLVAGARAVNFNPHFQYFSSPDPSDSRLGSEQCWPPAPVLLLLDSYEPSERARIIQQAVVHTNKVWILRLDRPSGRAMEDMQLIRSKHAMLAAIVPAKSLILHSQCCSIIAAGPTQSGTQQPLLMMHRFGNSRCVENEARVILKLQAQAQAQFCRCKITSVTGLSEGTTSIPAYLAPRSPWNSFERDSKMRASTHTADPWLPRMGV